MARRDDRYEPETFRDALETGQVIRWLRSQLVWGLGFAVLLGLAYGVLKLFPHIVPPPKTDVDLATRHVQAMWKAGDQAGAIAYFRPVAAQGQAQAEYVMGVLYATADGKLTDPVQAAQWFQKAADQHSAPAERELALFYRQGQGVAKDEAMALKLQQAAAGGGDANAQADLGQDYEDGVPGLAADPAQARTWYGRAAAKGGVRGQVNLSHLLFTGAGGPVDMQGAYQWSSLAASLSISGGDNWKVASANAAEARGKLTAGQIATADAWVKAWKAQD